MEKTVGFIGGVALGIVLAGAFGVDFFRSDSAAELPLKARGELNDLRRKVTSYREGLLQRDEELVGANAALRVTRERAAAETARVAEQLSSMQEERLAAREELEQVTRTIEAQRSRLTEQQAALVAADEALVVARSQTGSYAALLATLQGQWHESTLRFLRRQEGPGDAILVAEYLASAQSEASKRDVVLYLRQNRPETLLGLSAETATSSVVPSSGAPAEAEPAQGTQAGRGH